MPPSQVSSRMVAVETGSSMSSSQPTPEPLSRSLSLITATTTDVTPVIVDRRLRVISFSAGR